MSTTSAERRTELDEPAAEYVCRTDEITDTVCADFTFGVIGDTQYVDSEDGSTFDGSVVRRYRQSLDTLKKACFSFKISSALLCVLLGDTLDAKCNTMGSAQQCVDEIHDVLRLSDSPWHFCIGNHDLVCFSRQEVLEKLVAPCVQQMCSPSRLYYDFLPFPGFRFIFLDGYDVSTINASSDANRIAAEEILAIKNQNLAIPGASWFAGLSEENKRYVPYNGGLSDLQLDWFDDVIERARNSGERCFVFSHMPCNISCVRPGAIMWNGERILKIMHKYEGTVAAFIAGHDHDGGYAVDLAGIHHLVLPSPLECDLNELAFGHITVHSSSIVSKPFFKLHWTGKTPPSSYTQWPSKMFFP